MKVCCISAKAQHGKDTAAKILKEHLETLGNKVLIIHFADLLKFICANFFGWDGKKDEKGRTLLQQIGSKNSLYFAEWVVDFLELFGDEWDYVLIPDCRYPLEVKQIASHFDSVLLRIERPNFNNGLTNVQRWHISEIALDEYSFDAIIYNDSDIKSLQNKLRRFVENFLIKK